jgi:ribosome-binding factor A
MMKGRKKAVSRRPEQVGETIRQTLSAMLVQGEIRDPRVSMATVTSVKVAADLGSAKIWVALPGEKADQKKALEGLRSAAGFLRTRIAQELTTYTVPELRFEHDDGAARGARIDSIIADLKRVEDEAARAARDAQDAQDAQGTEAQADGDG